MVHNNVRPPPYGYEYIMKYVCSQVEFVATAENNKNVWTCEALYSAPVAAERAVHYKPLSQPVQLNVLRMQCTSFMSTLRSVRGEGPLWRSPSTACVQ